MKHPVQTFSSALALAFLTISLPAPQALADDPDDIDVDIACDFVDDNSDDVVCHDLDLVIDCMVSDHEGSCFNEDTQAAKIKRRPSLGFAAKRQLARPRGN